MFNFIFNYFKNNFYMVKHRFKMAKETIFYQYATLHVSIYPPRSTVLFAILNRLSTGQITQYCL